MDHLRSPSFDWYRGLMVRIGRRYDGIFSDTECVDVGALSAAVTRLRPLDNQRFLFSEFIGSQSFPDAWRTSQSPLNMIVAAQSIISKSRFIEAMAKCARYAIDRMSDPSNLMKNALDALDRQNPQECRFCHVNILNCIPFVQDDITFQTLYALADSLLPVFSHESYYTSSIPMRRLTNIQRSATARIAMANILRATIPFHEIAEGLVR